MAPPDHRSDTVVVRAGEVVEDCWMPLGDEAPPPCGDVIVTAERLSLDEGLLHGRTGRVGVCLPPGTDLSAIERFLPGLALAVLDFPAFRDGRGFGLARALRERFAFNGEVRAKGHLLPDQYVFLLRCGVDSIVLPAGADLAPWRAALGQFRTAYQPAANDAAGASPLKRGLALSTPIAWPA